MDPDCAAVGIVQSYSHCVLSIVKTVVVVLGVMTTIAHGLVTVLVKEITDFFGVFS